VCCFHRTHTPPSQGFGKSLCYQLLLPVFRQKEIAIGGRSGGGHSIAIVVCPLKTLAQDQVNTILDRDYNLMATVVNEETLLANPTLLEEVVAGAYELVYITPELLLDNTHFREMLRNKTYQRSLRFVAFDEFHLVVPWASFRPVFKRVSDIRALVPKGIPVLGLSATVMNRLRGELCQSIGMRPDRTVFVEAVSNRKRTKYSVTRAPAWDEWVEQTMTPILDDLRRNVASAKRVLIFIDNKVKVAKLHDWFNENLERTAQVADPYHALEVRYQLVVKLDGDDIGQQRDDTLEAITSPEGVPRVAIMTTTGSTGIDYPGDWNRVIVYMESDLAQLVQKFGRIGRSDDPHGRYSAELFWTSAMFHADKYFHPELQFLCHASDGDDQPIPCRRRFLLNCLTTMPYDWDDMFIPGHCCDLCDLRDGDSLMTI
jgi:ATP-dependent helicase YprA (DUF1998 family)